MGTRAGQPGPYIFLSYASADRERALRIADLLEAQGIGVWIDRHSIAGGSAWSAEIVRGIKRCRAVVVLCSPASMRSANVQRELNLAVEEDRPVVPLLLERVALPDEVRYALAGRQWVELLDRPEEAWRGEVLRALGHLGVSSGAERTGAIGEASPIGDVSPTGAAAAIGGPSHSRPLIVSPVAGRRGLAAPEPALHGLATRVPLVGRAEPLAILRATYEGIAAGAGCRLVLIGGEPGVGKTRLAEEVGRVAVERGGQFLAGHYPRDGTQPYGPWIEALRAGLRGVPPTEWKDLVGPYGADLARLLPELEGAIGPFLAAPSLPPEDQRRRLFEGVTALLAALAERSLVALLLDDLQWAPGLTLLVHVARQLGAARVLLLGTYRQGEFRDQPALMQDWNQLNRARLVTTLGLEALGRAETNALVAEYLGPDAVDRLGEAVYRSGLDAPRAIELLERALSLYEQVGNWRKLAAIHSQIGREYYSGGNLLIYDVPKALEHLHQARAILEEEPISVPLGWVYVILAFAYAIRLRRPESID